jgi:hypothetical protein
MNEGSLKGWKMQKHVQANVEDGALVSCNVNEEQVQMNVEVKETSIANLTIIEVDLQKTIKIIMEEKNVALALVQEEDEHVIGHVQINVNDIFILTYNLLPTHLLYLKGWVGFFLANLCLQYLH